MISKKILAVFKREYFIRVKSKGFIIGIFALPVIILFGIIVTIVLSEYYTTEQKRIYVIDQTGFIFDDFVLQFPDTLDNGDLIYDFIKKDVQAVEEEAVFETIQKEVIDEVVDGYIYIPSDLVESRRLRYAARNVSINSEQRVFASAISRIIINRRLENLGLSAEDIRREMQLGQVRIDTPQITDEGEVQSSGGVNFAIAYLLTFLLYISLFIFGAMMMRSVLEEKTQRITETIISSIKPFDLLSGKLAGICAVGITQLTIWGIFIYIPVTFGESIILRFAPGASEVIQFLALIHFSTFTLIMVIVLFILGFILYASMFAAIGAIVNTDDEAQQLQLFVMAPIMLQYFFFFAVVENPESSMAYWASVFPLFTPILMTARLSLLEPQIPDGFFLSIFLLIITVIAIMKLVSKIYRVGILMYGKRPSLKELIKWLKYS